MQGISWLRTAGAFRAGVGVERCVYVKNDFCMTALLLMDNDTLCFYPDSLLLPSVQYPA
jgi:hypothetical protein